MSIIYTGEVHTFRATFTDANGVVTDPDGVEAYIIRPDKTTLGPYVYGSGSEITRISTGIYAISVTPSIANTWEVWFGFRSRCDMRGDCLIGAVVEGVVVRDHTHLATLGPRPDSLLDVPVAPGFKGCCPLRVVVL